MFKKLCSLAAFSGLLLFSGCEINSPEYSADFLLPLVKTQIRIEDIDELVDPQFELVSVISADVPSVLTSSVMVVPAFAGEDVGPYFFIDDQDNYKRAKVDTAEFTLIINNKFPINIKAGTEVVIMNTTNDDIIFNTVLDQPIPPGGTRTIKVILSRNSPWIDNDLRMFLKNYGSDGSNGQLVNFTGAKIELVFRMNLIYINEIEIYPAKSYSIKDTIQVEFGTDDVSTIERGTLSLFVKNGFPSDFDFQGTFLDQNFQEISGQEKFITNIPSPLVQADGLINRNSIIEKKIENTQTRESMAELRTRARFMLIEAGFEVLPAGSAAIPAGLEVIRLKHTDNMPLQLVGDIRVVVTP